MTVNTTSRPTSARSFQPKVGRLVLAAAAGAVALGFIVTQPWQQGTEGAPAGIAAGTGAATTASVSRVSYELAPTTFIVRSQAEADAVNASMAEADAVRNSMSLSPLKYTVLVVNDEAALRAVETAQNDANMIREALGEPLMPLTDLRAR